MRKDNRLWFQRLWISTEILSNVWKKDSKKVGEVNGQGEGYQSVGVLQSI